MQKRQRVELLDYLRGFMALSILVYHYSAWIGIQYFPLLDNVISRLGLYGVLAFYVLSGASMGIVYSQKTMKKSFLIDFSIKRFFRLAPLFYIATTGMVTLIFIEGFISGDYSKLPSVRELVLNYTLTFGWLSPDSYITTGAWSIGNEMVFYSILPFMLFLLNKSTKYLYVFFVGTILASAYFSLHLIDPTQSLESQWATYINPIHLLYLFTAGFIIGTLLKHGVQIRKKYLLLLLVISISVFVFLPADDANRISYVTGYHKILFSISVFSFCLFATFWGETKKNVFTKIFKFLGDTSYSIYLVHPLVYIVLKVIFEFTSITNPILLILLSASLTLIASSVIYKYAEVPFVNRGRSVSEKATRKSQLKESTNVV